MSSSIDPRIAALASEATAWRRDFHTHPELGYAEHRTAKLVAERLRAFGCDAVVDGVGKTGVVGVIHGRNGPGGKVVGLRADMDALPISEETNLAYASRTANTMHACGHDGHTTMLLGAAKHLAATREFDGTVVVIFQPAEEGGAGGEAMVKEGILDRYGIAEVYGMHNMPGIKPGAFAIRPGPIMAAADRFEIHIEGRGSHAAQPHLGIDPLVIGAQIVNALQSIASRNVDPLKSVVVSTTMFQTGTAFNIIPQRAYLCGTVRTLHPEVRDLTEARMHDIVAGMAKMHGAEARLDYVRGYPATINSDVETGHAVSAAQAVSGAEGVNANVDACMGGEDFSFMLNERPGAYIFIGNGESAGLHHPAYDFNDTIIPAGVQFWTNIAEARTRG